jgi:2-keto-3-deoxy-L-rhamnonate aldolase RhmA
MIILEVPDVVGVFIRPLDLSGSMGITASLTPQMSRP